jgi:hypothetical protein
MEQYSMARVSLEDTMRMDHVDLFDSGQKKNY